MFRIAHISDLHIPPLPPVRPRSFVTKEIFGRLHWALRRRHEHRLQVLDALRSDLDHEPIDHLCITGDITNLGARDEFARARRWIEALGLAERRISVIPGNHDAYVPGALGTGGALWAAWMRDDDGTVGFPYLQRRGPVAVIGVSTARATPPGFAAGWLGRRQLRRLGSVLARPDCAQAFRILLIHHPPLKGVEPRRAALWDRRALARLLARWPVHLVLHGHAHRALRASLPGPAGPIAVRGAGAASRVGRHGPPAHYHLLALEEDVGAGAFRLAIRHRVYDPESARFAGQARETLTFAK